MNAGSWQIQQHAMAKVLLEPQAATPDWLATRNGASIAERLDVYRNNVHSSLIETLAATFPVAVRVVSEDSFRVLARAYLRAELPASAALLDYGAGLPAFIRRWEPAAPLPWLADLAALEHAWWQAYGAADAPTLSLREVAAVSGAALLGQRARIHPAARTLQSAHPVHSIWLAHQSTGDPAPPERWDPECVLLSRPEADVQVTLITAPAHTWLGALSRGSTIEDAATAALRLDPGFDLGTTLLLAIQAGVIQELHS
jgi:hypothetical protein